MRTEIRGSKYSIKCKATQKKYAIGEKNNNVYKSTKQNIFAYRFSVEARSQIRNQSQSIAFHTIIILFVSAFAYNNINNVCMYSLYYQFVHI